MKQLYDAKALAPNDFQKAEAAYMAAREQYSEAQEGARSEDKTAARAAVDQAAAGARVARKRLTDTKLLAPISGMIAHRNLNPGEMVGAGMPVFSIVDLNPVKVRVGVPETDIARVRTGQTATILIPAMAELNFEGRVELVGVAAEPASRSYTVKILVPNPNGSSAWA